MEKKLMKKICLLGDGAVGKTSLIKKYVFDKFDDKYIMTFGTKVTKKLVTISRPECNYNLTFLIWDILGQRVHNALHSTYYQGASGAFIVCDVSRQETIDNLDDWVQVFRKVNNSAPIIMLGNKSDLIQDPQPIKQQVSVVAGKYNIPFYFTSAKTGKHVENSFLQLGAKIVDQHGGGG